MTDERHEIDRIELALERLRRAATAYAWSMFYAGIAIGFVMAWMLCSMRPGN